MNPVGQFEKSFIYVYIATFGNLHNADALRMLFGLLLEISLFARSDQSQLIWTASF